MKNYPEQTENTENMSMHDMPDGERPREKAQLFGIESLTDAELMAIIFSTGIKGKSVLKMSQEIIDYHHGHLSFLTNMTVQEICSTFKGIGPAKALTLLAGLELGVRAAHDAARIAAENKPLTSPQMVWDIMHETLAGLQHEEFWVLYLNQAGKLVKKYRVGLGGMTATLVDVRLILREAILMLSTAMILVHNHPSGSLKPSEQDIKLTKKIVDAAKIHDIHVHDHIIFTDNSYYSFHSSGLLPE